MIASVFSIIQLILNLLGLWDLFLSWSDAKRLADAEANTQIRNAAVDDQKGAANEDQFDKDQSVISEHKPH